jgi:hypothetical protein
VHAKNSQIHKFSQAYHGHGWPRSVVVQQYYSLSRLYPARAEAPAGGSSPGPLGHSEAHAVSRLLVGGATRRMPNLLVTLRPLAGGSVAQRQLASADIACSHGISSAVLLQATAATNLEVKGMPHGI